MRTVLITGCSSGIGYATAQTLAADEGWKVFATARKLEALEGLTGCEKLALDVTDEGSMQAAVEAVGRVDVLVNNAGYSQNGAVESVPMDDVRRQFETNVFGLIRMCQLVLPGMREQRWGKIVNLSSMGGRLTFPGGGLYHATKYAVEALSDAMRFEVAGFGIDVILIEPGLITTSFSDTSVKGVPQEGPYASFNRKVAKATENAYNGPLSKLGGGPEAVATTIAKAIAAKRPKARYPVTPSAHLMINQRKLVPDRVWDLMMRAQFPTPD
jgi:NAD(P)-dependent dehydrogenase (short-subunit alcohol dehydrogenase family)